MSWLVGELVAKSELDTHPGPERRCACPGRPPPRRGRPFAGGLRAERGCSRQLRGAPAATVPLGTLYSGGWRVWPFKGARAGAVTADRVKAEGRLGNGVRAAPRVRQGRRPAAAPGPAPAGPGRGRPGPRAPGRRRCLQGGRGPAAGSGLSPPPCMDLPNKFHLVISLRRRRAVSAS